MRRLVLILLLLVSGKSFATGEINVLTDLNSPFPPGCVALSLPEQPFSAENTLYDEIINVPSVNSSVRDSQINVTIWRVGCHDPGHSVVMVRLQHVSGGDVLVPQVYAEAGEVTLPVHRAQLIRHPAVGDVGATGNFLTSEGITYMLAVDPLSFDGTFFGPADYNDVFTMELYWGDMAPLDDPAGELFPIASYAPALDPTQFEFPILHGRMTSAWIINGIPRSGMTLNIGEQADDTNYAFVLFFTYLDGEPVWITGNTDAGLEPGFDLIEMTMYLPSGGEFFGLGQHLFEDGDVELTPIGDMSIEALDCNTLLIGFDFSEAGLGSDVYEARRMVRNAGFDCNPWD